MMFIGGVDRVSSAKQEKRYKRKLSDNLRAKKALERSFTDKCPAVEFALNSEEPTDTEIDQDEDSAEINAENKTTITINETPQSSKTPAGGSQMRKNYQS